MNKFGALVKFEFMSSRSRFTDDKVFSRIKKALFSLIGVGTLAALFVYAVYVVLNVFVSARMEHEFVIIFSFFMMLTHFVVGIVASTKSLFLKADLSLLNLPVSGEDVLSAKIFCLYLKQLFLSCALSLPVFVLFGIKTAQSLAFYLLLVPNVLFLPVVPFLLSILFSVPVMYLIKTFKNKFLILVAFYILILVAGFMLYIYALKFILSILESGNFSDVFDNSTIYNIKQFASYLYPALLFKNSLLFYNFWKSAVINFTIFVVLAFAIWLFAKRFYFKLLILSKNQPIFSKKTQITAKKPAYVLIGKEFKNIFRSSNYAFQYLTIVFTTPLMVYFSSQIASGVGAPLLGKGILPGVVVLILIMFLSMGTSFSATSITREGGNFFLTKIIPISFTQQVLVKFLIYLIISVPAIFISCYVLAFAGIINYTTALLIGIALSFVIVGNICNSISLDIKHPQFKHLENGEVASNNRNISASIGLGFAISFLMGIGGILLSFFIGISSMYAVLFSFGVPYALIEFFRLFFHLERRYNAIEV